jgi:hypothetical protein
MPDNVEVRTQHSIGVRWSPKWMRDRLDDGMRNNGEIAMHFNMDDIGEDTKVSVARKARAAVDEFAYSADDKISEKHFKESISEYSDAEKEKIVGYAEALWKDYNSQSGVTRVPFDAFRKRWALARPNLAENGWGIDPIDVLFIDEAQDTPPVLAKVYRDQIDNGIQLVVVGDPDQAIYGFTGAVNFLDDLGPVMDTHLPLAKSYRYGPVIGDIANRFLQLKQSLGRVVGGGDPDSRIERGMQDPKAILTRTNAGMIAHIIDQMQMEKKVAVPEGTKKDLLWLVDSAKGLRIGYPMRKPHDDFAGYGSWEEFVKEAQEGDNPVAVKNYRLFANGDFDTLRAYINNLIEPNTGGADGIMSKIVGGKYDDGTVFNFGYNSGFDSWDYKDDLRELGFQWQQTAETYKKDYYNKKTKKQYKAGDRKPSKAWVHTGTDAEQAAALEELKDRIRTKAGLVPDVTISTAHKAKGLEWESVKIGDDFKGPTVDEDGNTVFPSEEELNLAYVAVTRAESRLDPGSLDYIFDYTDENGGIPEAKPDEHDLDARIEKREEQLDDRERNKDHLENAADGTSAPTTPENPEVDEAATDGNPDAGEYVTAPGIPEHLNPEVQSRDPEPDLIGNDDGDRLPLQGGYSYRFNDNDDGSNMGIDVYDPDGNKIGEVQVADDLTTNEMNDLLNRYARGEITADEPDDVLEPEEVEPPEPEPDVPGQDDDFDTRYPEPTGAEAAEELQRKADELLALVTTMDRSDPDYMKVFTRALSYADAARGAGDARRAAANDLTGGENRPGPAHDDENGLRDLDPGTDYTDRGGAGFGFIETQIPSPGDDTESIDRDAIGKGIMWDLDDPNYFARVSQSPNGRVRVQVFRENGNKPAIPVDTFEASAGDTSPAELAHMALDSLTRHKNKRRKGKPDDTDAEVGGRVWEAVKTGNREGLSEQELEWAVQLEYTMKNDKNLDFSVLEDAIRNGRNPTMTNFLKYMHDQNGDFRFWAKGDEAGTKMRVGDHAWQWFEDTEKGQAFRRGEGPPDVRHGRIVALPTHSQPNATIWAHDEDGNPMWTTDKKTGEPIPKLYRYHLNRVNKFYGLDSNGFALAGPDETGRAVPPARGAAPASTPTAPTPPPISAGPTLGQDPDVLQGTPDVDGVSTFSNNGYRYSAFHDDDLTPDRQWDKIRELTDDFNDMRHGDTFDIGSNRVLFYDENTDQMFMYRNGRYYGAQDGFDVRDPEMVGDLLGRLEGTRYGDDVFSPTADTGFNEVPRDHYMLRAQAFGAASVFDSTGIETYMAMNGHEVIIKSGHTEYGGAAGAAHMASHTKAVLDRIGRTLGGTKIKFVVPTYDFMFDRNNPKGVALAYVDQLNPSVVVVNPELLNPDRNYKTGHFHEVAEDVHGLDYTLTHELGHTHDAINNSIFMGRGKENQILRTNDDFFHANRTGNSGYGQTNHFEAYAEAYAQWVLGGPGSSEVADAYAAQYGWDAADLGPMTGISNAGPVV